MHAVDVQVCDAVFAQKVIIEADGITKLQVSLPPCAEVFILMSARLLPRIALPTPAPNRTLKADFDQARRLGPPGPRLNMKK